MVEYGSVKLFASLHIVETDFQITRKQLGSSFRAGGAEGFPLDKRFPRKVENVFSILNVLIGERQRLMFVTKGFDQFNQLENCPNL